MITDILFQPSGGKFDVGVVNQWIQENLHAARDPVDGRTWMVGEDPEQVQRGVTERATTRDAFPASMILIDVDEKRVDVSFRTPRVEPARDFALWLRQNYNVKIMDDAFSDLTALSVGDLEYLFGPRTP